MSLADYDDDELELDDLEEEEFEDELDGRLLCGGLDVDELARVDNGPRCRGCGCTQNSPCQTAAGTCVWVSFDLCSACAIGGSR
jgi:hypothetical protein